VDTIEITGIRAYGYIGALPEENILGQWFEVDLTLFLDLTLAGQSDNLVDTHDYRRIITGVQQMVRQERFKLLERLAGAISDFAFSSDQRLHQVKVRVTKPTPPIPDFGGQISVEIMRLNPKLSIPQE
jgi:dihydroneopterin aldolase